MAPYPLDRAPSQRYRWEQYIGPLAQRDIHLEPSTFMGPHALEVAHASGAWASKVGVILRGLTRRIRDLFVVRSYDLVLVHRESLPIGPAWIERILNDLKVPYAFDFDDAIYLQATSDANQRFAWLKRSGKAAQVLERASLVVAGNSFLADWAQEYARHVVVIPTTIDTDAYRVVERRQDGRVCVGWSGSPTTIQHLKWLEPVLRELQRDHGIRIRVIGDASYRIKGAEIESLAWNPATEVADLSELDIGVMPLPDDEWARGKCGCKALQYMALGIPTVLSPVGVNSEIARNGAAILASTTDDWFAALRTLIHDQELRAQVGAAGRVRVEREYSVRSTLTKWERALREAAEI